MSLINLDIVLDVDQILRIDYEEGKDGLTYTKFIFNNNRPPLILLLTERESLIFQKKLVEAHLRKEIVRLEGKVKKLEVDQEKLHTLNQLQKTFKALKHDYDKLKSANDNYAIFIGTVAKLFGIGNWGDDNLSQVVNRIQEILSDYHRCLSARDSALIDRNHYHEMLFRIGKIVGPNEALTSDGKVLDMKILEIVEKWNHERQARQAQTSDRQADIGHSTIHDCGVGSQSSGSEGESMESEGPILADDGE